MPHRPTLLTRLLGALLLAGCGGENAAQPELVAPDAEPIDACTSAARYEFQPIVDFEPWVGPGGETTQARCQLTTSCSLYFSADTASSPPSFRSTPDPGVTPWGTSVPGGRCGEDAHALNIQAFNLATLITSNGRKGWGAALGLQFSAVDVSAWDGISFWVRRTTPPTLGDNRTDNRSLIAAVADAYTSGPENMAEGVPSYCSTSSEASVPDTAKCDPFGVAVALTDEWSFVPARFSAMRQKGFGVPSPLGALDTSAIVSIQILMTAGDWDFWVDDISLFRAAE